MTAHIRPLSSYFLVFGALAALLALTLLAAKIPFPEEWMGVAVALAIAAAKVVLIAYYFMHLREAVPLVRTVAYAGLTWGVIGTSLTMADYLTRGWRESPSPLLESRAVDRFRDAGRASAPPEDVSSAVDQSRIRED